MRLTGLDLLRSIIMFFGPTFHASMLLFGVWGFYYEFSINNSLLVALDFTHYFRMQLFFLISGFFSSLVISRKGSAEFKKNRINRILLPTASSIIIILPIIFGEMYFLLGDRELSHYLSYKHLWFLVVLSVINIILMASPEAMNNLARSCSEKLNRLNWVVIISFFTFFIYVFAVIGLVINNINKNYSILELFQVNGVITYLPYFITGMLIFFIDKKPGVPMLIFFAIFYTAWYFLMKYELEGYQSIMKFTSRFASLLVCISIFYCFKNMQIKETASVNFLTKMALPFYLCHLPIMILLSWVWLTLDVSHNPLIFILTIVPANCLLSLVAGYVMMKIKASRTLFGLTQPSVPKSKVIAVQDVGMR